MSEEIRGDRAVHQEIVVRAMLFAVASLAAWWCWSSVASAEEVGPEPAAPESAPVLFPVVVAPLVDAVAPVVDPTGVVVFPVVDAVTTPAAPVLQSVTPVADQLVGPVVGPAVAPAVGAVTPVVEQVAGSVAHAGQLVAPALVPVTGMVSPAVDQVFSALTAPVAGATQPATQSALELDPRYVGLRPAATDVPIGIPVGIPADGGPAVPPNVTAEAPALLPSASPVEAETTTGRHASLPTNEERGLGSDLAALATFTPARAPADPPPVPSDGPFHPALPPACTVSAGQGASDPGQRSSCLPAVLPVVSGATPGPTEALVGIAVVLPLTRLGGRPPITPD